MPITQTSQPVPPSPAPPGATTAPTRWSFELRIRPYGDSAFRIHLLSSPAGDEVAELELPFPAGEIDGVVRELERSAAGHRRHLRPEMVPPTGTEEEKPDERLRTIGEALFEALFPPPVRRRWQECVDEIGQEPGRGLRLVLKSDPTCPATADLHRLPWELLRDPRTGGFLALSRKTTVVRQLTLDDAAVLEEPEPARKLRILAVLSAPPGLEPLDLARERRTIEEAVAERSEIELTLLENPTFSELTDTLRSSPFHVLHFMGHGTFDRDAREGHLLLPGPDGRPVRLAADRLTQVIRDVDSLRLVFLNACETGRAMQGSEQPFAGLAHALIRGGVPAVVAMQVAVPDRAAIELSRVFYRRLAAGETVDEALAEARVAVFAARSAEGAGGAGAWAVPALFVDRPELKIFRPRRAGSVDRAGTRGTRGWRRIGEWWGSKSWQELGTLLGGFGILLGAVGAGLRILGLFVHRARETLAGIPPLDYPEHELFVTGLDVFWQLPWRGASALTSSHDVLQGSAWGLLLLSVAVVVGGSRLRRWRRGGTLLLLVVGSLLAFLLFRGTMWTTVAARAQNLDETAGQNTALCTNQLSRNWADLVPYETCSWLVNDTATNHELRQSLGGLPLWLMIALVCTGLALLRAGELPRHPGWRWWRIALLAALAGVALLNFRLWPTAHAYSTWGLHYPAVTILDRGECGHLHELAEATAADLCCAYDVTETAEGKTLRLLGAGCPQSEGTIEVDEHCTAQQPGGPRALGQGCK